ncbi:hypothetical protein M758_4G053100 [Ceratodon purpureus]|uniref:Uncharacterized protein n=1 Tax=Ceratodon purpureus TaxID=3225 RepID=A0A8T0I5Z4_CERPU|nr:hypothetical protein KC19_4G056200 [Ceratodon purpureus]KAG0618301.1 hypothetical protein M758_4G053100 [Ceratodon purpureus]
MTRVFRGFCLYSQLKILLTLLITCSTAMGNESLQRKNSYCLKILYDGRV